MSEKEVTEKDNLISLHNLLIGFVVLLGIFGQILFAHPSPFLFGAIALLGCAIVLFIISYLISDIGWRNRNAEKELDEEIDKQELTKELVPKIFKSCKKREKINMCGLLNDILIVCISILIITSIILFIISLGGLL